MTMRYAVCGLVTALSVSAFAGPEHIIKQRAKDLSNQNNARQGAPANTAPARAAAPVQYQAAPPPKPLTPEQQRLARVQNTVAAIRPGAAPTPQLKAQLARELTSLATGPAKPSSDKITRLTENLCLALNEKLLSNITRNRLLQNVQTVLNPGNTTPQRTEEAIKDAQKLLEGGGVSKSRAAAVAGDLKTISTDTLATKTAS